MTQKNRLKFTKPQMPPFHESPPARLNLLLLEEDCLKWISHSSFYRFVSPGNFPPAFLVIALQSRDAPEGL